MVYSWNQEVAIATSCHPLRYEEGSYSVLKPRVNIIDIMKRILTGDRPTLAQFHLGNYIGTLKNRLNLQDDYEMFIMLADIHALTTHFRKTEEIQTNIKKLVLGYLSIGLNPKKVNFFVQSQVPAISEISVYLGMITPLSILEKQPALKEKLDQGNESTFGLLGYPVLMAADILSFNADLVPVGKDQKAHVEFARDIAQKFNHLYGDTFTVPEPLIGEVPTLVGTDGQAKMSKSLNNAIYLDDSPAEIEKKVRRMYTDPKRVRPTDPGQVEGNPVFIYHEAFNADKAEVEDLKDRYQKGQVGDVEVKEKLVKALNRFLLPIRERRAQFEKQKDLVEELLFAGGESARNITAQTLGKVKGNLGLR